MLPALSINTEYELRDRYLKQNGRIFLTGIQALTRLPIMQAMRDRAAGLNTAGFVSGYRGSPLGGYDQEMVRSKEYLEQYDIHFKNGLNEDLAATAVWGTQQLGLLDGAKKMAYLECGTARGPELIGPVMPFGTPMHSGLRGTAVCSRSPETITASSPRRLPTRVIMSLWGMRCRSFHHPMLQKSLNWGLPDLHYLALQGAGLVSRR